MSPSPAETRLEREASDARGAPRTARGRANYDGFSHPWPRNRTLGIEILEMLHALGAAEGYSLPRMLTYLCHLLGGVGVVVGPTLRGDAQTGPRFGVWKLGQPA